MRPNPDLWLPPPGQGFPLLPGREEELVNLQKGDGDGEVKNNVKKRQPELIESNEIQHKRKPTRRYKAKNKTIMLT